MAANPKYLHKPVSKVPRDISRCVSSYITRKAGTGRKTIHFGNPCWKSSFLRQRSHRFHEADRCMLAYMITSNDVGFWKNDWSYTLHKIRKENLWDCLCKRYTSASAQVFFNKIPEIYHTIQVSPPLGWLTLITGQPEQGSFLDERAQHHHVELHKAVLVGHGQKVL